MSAFQESPVSPVDSRKVRLDDEQMETLADALKVAAAAMRGGALLAESLGETWTAEVCEERARRFELLTTLSEGVTRVTVRF